LAAKQLSEWSALEVIFAFIKGALPASDTCCVGLSLALLCSSGAWHYPTECSGVFRWRHEALATLHQRSLCFVEVSREREQPLESVETVWALSCPLGCEIDGIRYGEATVSIESVGDEVQLQRPLIVSALYRGCDLFSDTRRRNDRLLLLSFRNQRELTSTDAYLETWRSVSGIQGSLIVISERQRVLLR